MEVEDGILCLSCGKTRKMLSKMRAHLISHGIDNQHPCPFCERVPTSEDARRNHIQKIHKKALSFKQIRALPPFQDQVQNLYIAVPILNNKQERKMLVLHSQGSLLFSFPTMTYNRVVAPYLGLTIQQKPDIKQHFVPQENYFTFRFT